MFVQLKPRYTMYTSINQVNDSDSQCKQKNYGEDIALLIGKPGLGFRAKRNESPHSISDLPN